MGTVEIVPEALVGQEGAFVIGGGAASTLIALNDGSDTTYVRNNAAGQPWSATFLMASAAIPAGAVVEHVQMRMRYSHATQVGSGNHEIIKPARILVGKPAGAGHTFWTYTTGEKFPSYSGSTSPQQLTGPPRPQSADGHYLGQLLQLFASRLYATVETSREFVHNTARIYALSLVVTYNEPPVVTVTRPTGTEVISRPPFAWTRTDAEGDPQVAAHAKVFTAAQVAAPGFDPNTTVPLLERNEWTGVAGLNPNRAFGPNGNYVAYVRIAQRNIAGLSVWSAWDDSAFTLAVESPAAPSLDATYDAAINAVHVAAAGIENMLSWLHSSFEAASVTGITLDVNTTGTPTQAATAEPHGTWSYQLSRSGSTGTAGAAMPANAGAVFGVPVTADSQYQARAKFRAATTGRTVRVGINWYDASGVFIGQTFGTGTDNNAGWTEVTVTGTAPAGAAWAKVRVDVQSVAVGENHYVDTVGLFPGASVPAWTRGGFVHEDHTFELQRSLDAGITWEDVPTSAFASSTATQTLDFWDYEVPSATSATYRARINTTNQDADPVSSDWTAPDTAAVPAFTSWWLRDLSSPGTLSLPIRMRPDYQRIKPKPASVGYGLGSRVATVVHQGTKADVIPFKIDLLTKAAADKFEAMVDSGRTLLLQDVLGHQWYVQPGDVTLDPIHAQPTAAETTPVRYAYTASGTFTSVARPRG